ncbi:hypothetical protein KW790_00040 [Candidatus Parcubacteria bacterium]|nr:hypothetical protein [Candidatus Parcubacteria bacterium]
MTLAIKYSLKKDIENFIKGLSSVNSKVPTKLQEEFTALNGANFSVEAVKNFLKDKVQSLDLDQKISEILSKWELIEKAYTTRCEELFGISISDSIGYISLNQRCTYNWRENYFFIYYDASNPLKTIMHELLHFYTHRKYDPLNLDPKKFNDIKESLTVILNTEFSDLMNGADDKGYQQHQDMRFRILELRKQGKSIDEVVSTLSSLPV